jgi:hypothetical protein
MSSLSKQVISTQFIVTEYLSIKLVSEINYEKDERNAIKITIPPFNPYKLGSDEKEREGSLKLITANVQALFEESTELYRKTIEEMDESGQLGVI